jgi:hypothetical protein
VIIANGQTVYIKADTEIFKQQEAQHILGDS